MAGSSTSSSASGTRFRSVRCSTGWGRTARAAVTGALIAGPERLSDPELLANRAPTVQELREHPLLDDYYAQRTADLSRIEVPVLSATNWGYHLHTRGGFEGYLGVPGEHKWLEVHGLQHWVEFYTDYGVRLQKRFFGHFLKGEDTGWAAQPPVTLRVRPETTATKARETRSQRQAAFLHVREHTARPSAVDRLRRCST